MRTALVGLVLALAIGSTGLMADAPRGDTKGAGATKGADAPKRKPVTAIAAGYVFDIDVSASEGRPAVCAATVCMEKDGTGERVFVHAFDPRLQATLESAAARKVFAEVWYQTEAQPVGERRTVIRVRLLDLPEQQPKPNK
ncbi:unnamed protein product [Gemmata massiliana]|uniref:Uncharacterized protein n=1 Tax=Gemmata massiliana TaxID=1210884 RepID=A0A6P2DDC0_9BACT|nr:hypothetical protein [Gemmata massiliana]VTR99371.1 unnamed protein product [Gemmata massiliana]